MFAFSSELLSLIRKDPIATDEEKRSASRAVECRPERCVTFKDAASRLSLSKASVYKLVKSGRLSPAYANGRRPYGVTESSLVKLQSQRAFASAV
jgi:hypothetical protein